LVSRQRLNYKEIIVDTSTNLTALDITPTSRYAFAGNTNDSVGANNLTATGGPTYGTTTGLFGQYIIFDGATQFLQAASNSVFDVTTGDFSLWGWHYRTASPVTQCVCSKKDPTSGTAPGYRILLSQGETLAEINDGTGAVSVTTNGGLLNPTNKWLGWAATFDRDALMTAYVYNAETATLTSASTSIASKQNSLSNTQTFTIARQSSGTNFFFAGRMDHLNVFLGTALTTTQVKQVFNDLGTGQLVYPLTTGGSFTAGTLAVRNVENTAWTAV